MSANATIGSTRDSRRRWFAGVRLAAALAMLSVAALLVVSQDGAHADATCSVPPINLTSALGEDGASVVLHWEASGECTPDVYAVHRRDLDVAGARMVSIGSVAGDVLTYTDTTVSAGQTYRYGIRSNDQGPRSGRTDITIPEATVIEPEPATEDAERSPRQNVVRDATAPLLLAANVDGTSLVLIYSELLSESSTPAGSDFTVDIGGTDYTPSSVAVRGAEVELTLSTGAASGDTVSLDYTAGTNPVEDPTGNDAVALTSWSVTNHTGATNDRPEFASDTITISVDESVPSLSTIGDPVAASDDDTGDTLTYQLHSDVAPTIFIDTSTGQVSVFGNLDFETTSTYVAPMYVRDSKTPAGDADSAWDDSIKVTIIVNDVNEPPVITGDTAPDIDENTTTVGTYTVSDDDPGDTHTWSIHSDTSVEENQDGALFEIGSTSGILSFKNAPDYESPGSATTPPSNSYQVTIVVTDNGSPAMSANFDVIVDVINVNEPPSISGLSTGQLNEGTLTSHVIYTYIAPDPEDDSLTWSLAGNDAGDFTINSSTGALTFSAVPDYEYPADHNDNNTYEFTVQVSDGKNAQGGTDNTVDDTIIVTITVLNVNEAPVITTTGTAFTTISAPEGTLTTEALVVYEADDPEVGGDTITWTLGGADAARFTITGNNTGEARLRFQAIPDFESPLDDGMNNVFNVIVQVRDGKINTLGSTNGDPDTAVDDSIVVTITVTNVDEAGTVTITGTESGGETLTASVSDIDGMVTGASWSWHRSGTTPGSFSGIPGATANTYTTVAADVGKKLKAIVLYTDPHAFGKTASAETGVISASNVEPSFSSMTATRSVDENSGSGVNVGSVVSATGGDSDPLHYTLSGTDALSFTIVATSGQIQTKTNINYNYESKSSYTVTVNVSDSKDAAGNDDSNSVDDSITVTINLDDVNEQPTITTGATTASVAENTPATTGIITFVASDPDASTTYSWSVEPADDGGKFDISSSGVLTFKTSPNFEMPTDAGMNNVYNVTVKVTDNGTPAMSDTHQFAVTVTNVNEAPRITSTGSSHTEPAFAEIEYDADAQGLTVDLVVATYTASDVDADDTGQNWTWHLSGNDAGDFTITRNADGDGVLSFSQRPDFENPVDADTMNDYDLTVIVRDDGNLEDTLGVEVMVEDVNERPRIVGDTFVLLDEVEFDLTDAEVALERLLEVFDYDATDQENDTITWSITADPPDTASVGHMEINATTGLLSFKSGSRPNFEFPVDGDSDNTYAIRVRATDDDPDDSRFTEVGVLVRIQNKNEKPEIPAGVPDEVFAEIEWDAMSPDLAVMTYIPRDEETSAADLTMLSWSLAGTDAADFQITEDATTGHGTLSFRNPPNFEDPSDRVNTTESHAADDNMYEVIVRISDGPNTREYPMTVTVTNINETPEFTRMVGPGLHAMEIEYDSGITASDLSSLPATVENQSYVYPIEARDEEGDDIVWTITGSDAADFVITENPNVERPNSQEGALIRWNIVPDFENPLGSSSLLATDDTYLVTVNASDGVNVSEHEIFIRIDDVNERPEFTGTIESAVALDEHDATLDTSFQEPPYAFPTIASYTGRDEEGGVTWSLTGADAADFEIDSGGNVVFKETPSFEDPKDSGGDNVYNFIVVVTDILSKSNRRTAEQPVIVTVRDIEETGVIQVSNLDPVVGDTIRFTLSDPDGEIDTDAADITWTLRAREAGLWQPIAIPIAASTTLTYTVDEDDAGKRLRAEVSYYDRRSPDRVIANRKMLTSAETSPVEANPLPNVPPRFRSGTSQAIEEGAAGRVLPDRITATDRDGDSLTFAIEAGQDSALFEIDPSSGQITAVGELDFETAGPQGLLFFSVSLHDGRGLDVNNMVINDDSIDVTADVSVRVIDVEEEGVVTLSDLEPEAGTPVTATLEDGDGGVTGQSWQWSRSQDGRTGWSPASGSGATSNRYTPTVNDEDSYLRAVVEYTDRRGGGKRAEAITNPVPSENRRPLFPASETGQRMVDENTRAGSNVGAPVAAEDPERDRLTYSLSGADATSFTITNSGQIRVGSGTTLDFETKSSYSLTVEVHDGKDGTGATSTDIDDTQDVTITVQNVEEPGTVTLSSETATIQARVPVTASLEDDDIPTNVTWQWSRSRSSTSGWANIAGATSATFTPQDSDVGGYIRAIAGYRDGEGSGKTAVKVSPRVGQPPPVNSAPAFPATERGQRELAEDAIGGTAVGDPVAATDFNNDALTYTLSGTDAALFTIGSSDGQIRVANGAQLDFETKRTLRVTVEVSDGADSLGDLDDDAIDDRQNVVITLTNVNEAPVVSGDAMPSVAEDTSAVVATYTAADPERDTIAWSVNSTDFWILSGGQLYFRSTPDYENGGTSFSIRVTATDPDGLAGHLDVTVTVTDVEEAGVVTVTPLRGWEGTRFEADLSDGDGSVSGETWKWERSRNRSSWAEIEGATSSVYTAEADDVGHYLRASVEYTDQRGGNKEASATIRSPIADTRPGSNGAPSFIETSATRSVGQGSGKGRPVGAPVRAEDPDPSEVLTYELMGSDADHFTIDPLTGQIRTNDVLVEALQDTYTVDVIVTDGFDSGYNASDAEDDRVEVVITVTGGAFVRSGSSGRSTSGGGGGGGGGAPAAPVPSEADFDWNVTRDLEELDPENENPTGIWSDGETIWVLENSTTGPDRVFTYDLLTGDRIAEAEFELDARNRFSHGIWSDGEVVWIADSGQDRLFAYRLEDGERLAEQDIDLDARNRDPRGIWSDGERMYVVDSVKDALFVYDLASGELLAEYELDSLNRSPRGVWSDGVTIWISDDGAKRVFAYRIEDDELKRLEAEEFSFRSLLKAGNGDARGIWSDLGVLWIADATDARLYSYNMPDAIDARLTSLSLSSVDIGAFSPLKTDYRGWTSAEIGAVEAMAAQDDAVVVIAPADSDADNDGHQVALTEGARIDVTVTSADGSRQRVYRVTIARDNRAPLSTDLPALRLTAGGNPARIDLAGYFRDPDGDPLSYTLGRPADPGVATTAITNAFLVVTPLAAGQTSATVAAGDGSLSSDTVTLSITVEAAAIAPEVRIAARRVSPGHFEFALQQRSPSGVWQDRTLPRLRFFPVSTVVGRWLNSSALTVGEGDSEHAVRISAHRTSAGRIEFAVQVRSEDGEWNERLLPRARFLRTSVPLERWFVSSPLEISEQ